MEHDRTLDPRNPERVTGRLRRVLLAAASVAMLGTAGAVFAQAAETPADAPPPPPPPAWGQHQHDGKWKGHGNPLRRMTRELNLTDAQQTQIREIFQKSHQDGEALRKKMGDLHKEMQALIQSGNYTDAKARAIAGKYEPLFADMTVHAAHTMNEVRSVLTPEQRAKADEMAAKRREHMGGFMGPPPEGPPPAPPGG